MRERLEFPKDSGLYFIAVTEPDAQNYCPLFKEGHPTLKGCFQTILKPLISYEKM